MDERRKWTIVLMTITVFVMTTTFLPGLVRAGNLEPSDPPGSTMHTLDEIYNKLEQIVPDDGSMTIPETGQTESYAAGDDGDLEKGVAWPYPRFTDHGDETVTDHLTGLMWTKDANMYGQKKWTEALSDCAGCTAGDLDDWRLPNLRELHSLIDYGRFGPALPSKHPFSNIQSSLYWSSTSSYANPAYAWYVSLDYGVVNGNGDKNAAAYFWCVRGGQ